MAAYPRPGDASEYALMIELDCRPWNKWNLHSILRDSTPSSALGYLYVPLGKAANTEVKRHLWELEVRAGSDLPLPDDYFAVHNFRWAEASDARKTPWDGYNADDIDRLMADLMNKFAFTVVRNPYAKLLSGYLDKVVRWQGRVARNPDTNETSRFSLASVPTSFADFVDIVCAQPDRETDLHWTSQTYKTLFHFVKYNHIGHFEDLPGIFARINRRFVASEPERENVAGHRTSASGKVREHYTDAIAAKVYDRYREDFETFGYSADPFAGSLAPIRPALPSGEYSDFCRPLSRVIKHVLSGERRKAGQVLQRVQERAARIQRALLLDESLEGLLR
jgi:hypothetical protein